MKKGRKTDIGDVTDNLGDFKRDGLALGDHALYCTCTNDVSECRLGTFDKRLPEV